MKAAQNGVNCRLKMLRANGRQPNQPHSVVVFARRREITPAVDGDVVARARKPAADLLVISLDSAVFPDHSASADEGDSQLAFLARHLKGRPEIDFAALPLAISSYKAVSFW